MNTHRVLTSLPLFPLLVGCVSTGAARVDVSKPGLSEQLGCSPERLRSEWLAEPYGRVQVGEDLCLVLGRWGEPAAYNLITSSLGTSYIARWGGAAQRDRAAPSMHVTATRYLPDRRKFGPSDYVAVEWVSYGAGR